MTENAVELRYQNWESVVRAFIKQAETNRALGAVEIAKALLLYGMKLYQDLLESSLGESERLIFVQEMQRRSKDVLRHCSNEIEFAQNEEESED